MKNKRPYGEILYEFYKYKEKAVPTLRRNLELLSDKRMHTIQNKLFNYIRNRAINDIVKTYIIDICETWEILNKAINKSRSTPFDEDTINQYKNVYNIRNKRFIHKLESSISNLKHYDQINEIYNTSLEFFDITAKLGDIMYEKVKGMFSKSEIIRGKDSLINYEEKFLEADIEKLASILNKS